MGAFVARSFVKLRHIGRRALLLPTRILDQTFGSWLSHKSLAQIGNRLRQIFGYGLAAAVLGYVARQQLEVDQYFFSFSDYFNRRDLIEFVSDKWEILLLLFDVTVLVLLPLSIDSSKYVTHGLGCFSQIATPRREVWKDVKGRYIILWVVISNVPIFLGAALYSDNVAIFSLLLMAHHINGALWIQSFRWNVRFFFRIDKYQPPPQDLDAPFILKRREVMKKFLCEENNLTREIACAIAYGSAGFLTLIAGGDLSIRCIAYLLIFVFEWINQYVAHQEIRERDRGLAEIEEEEELAFANATKR